eukprot:EG_transcript_385
MLSWIASRVRLSLSVSEAAWNTFFTPERAEHIEQWLMACGSPLLLFYPAADEPGIACALEVPANFTQKKAVALLRAKRGQPLAVDAIREELSVMELAADTVEGLVAEMRALYLCFSRNPRVNGTWPPTLANEVEDALEDLATQATFLHSRASGVAVLPMPSVAHGAAGFGDEKRRFRHSDENREIHMLESSVASWLWHIRHVIALDPEEQFELLEKKGGQPGPLLLLDCWRQRHTNLHRITAQLQGPAAGAMLATLRASNSDQVPALAEVMAELQRAQQEAHDLTSHYEVLRPHVRAMQGRPPEELVAAFPKVLHLLALMWFTSKHITAARLGILLRAVAYEVVNEALAFVEVATLWTTDFEEAQQRLAKAITVCSHFKTVFFHHRQQLNANAERRRWDFDAATAFLQLDRLIDRLREVRDLLRHRVEFGRIATLELGGDRDRTLVGLVRQITADFQAVLDAFVADPGQVGVLCGGPFEANAERFHRQVQECDRQLCNVLSQAFAEGPGLGEGLRLVESCEPLTVRPTVRADFARRCIVLEQLMEKELYAVQGVFQALQHEPPAHPLLPGFTSSLCWVRGLIARVREPMDRLAGLHARTQLLSQGLPVLQALYDKVLRSLLAFEADRLQAHQERFTDFLKNTDLLDRPLLARSRAKALVVNFDPQVALTFDELRHIQALPEPGSPGVEDQHQHRELLRLHHSHLDFIAVKYNGIMQALLEVERPLVRTLIARADAVLLPAFSELTWRSPAIAAFIEEAEGAVTRLHTRLTHLKGNVQTIEKIVRSWRDMWRVLHLSDEEVRRRRMTAMSAKVFTLWSGKQADSMRDRLARKWFKLWRHRVDLTTLTVDDIVRQHWRILNLINNSRLMCGAELGHPHWISYVEYVSNIYKRGFVQAMKNCLLHLIKHLELQRPVVAATPRHAGRRLAALQQDKAADSPLPSLDVTLELRDQQLVFTPPIDPALPASVQARILKWANGVFSVAKRLACIDDPSVTYYTVISKDEELRHLGKEVLKHMHATVDRLTALRQEYLRYSFLWTDNPEEFVRRFAKGEYLYGGDLGPADGLGSLDLDRDPTTMASFAVPVPVKRRPVRVKPSLEEFEAQIQKYQQLHLEVLELPTAPAFNWVHVNAQPLQTAVASLAQRWSVELLAHLQRKVTKKLAKLEQFMAETAKGIGRPVNSFSSLLATLGHLAALAGRTLAVEGMFDPLQETVALLHRYGMSPPARTLELLEALPQQWRELKRRCLEANESLVPLQAQEVERIHEMEEKLKQRISDFRAAFLDLCPLQPAAHAADTYQRYAQLRAAGLRTAELDRQLRAVQERQRLFQLMVVQGKELASFWETLRLMKAAWDAVAVVLYEVEGWEAVALSSVRPDEMETEARRLLELLQGQDRAVQRWPFFTHTLARLEAFRQCLPLAQSLCHPAMRERHWRELLERIGIPFDVEDSFTLRRVAALRLHENTEEVTAIVQRAAQEAAISDQVLLLQTVWKDLCFEFVTQEGEGFATLKAPDHLQSLVEEHQLLLQGLGTNRAAAIYMA